MSGTCTFTFTANDPYTSNTGSTATITVNPIIQITTKPSIAVTTEVGASIPVNALATGGTGSFTYSYTSTCAGYSSGSTNTLAFTPTASGSCAFTFTANDIYASNSATTATITINPVIQITTKPSIAVTTEVGASIPVNALATGGTYSFTYSYTSSGCGGLSGSTNTLTFTPVAAESCTFTFTANDIYTSNSASTATITVNALPTISISPTTSTTDAGQSVTFTNTTSGGTKPYTFSYTVNSLSGVTITGNTITFANVGTFNVLETVTDAFSQSVSSSNSVITVNSKLIASAAPTVSNSITDSGQPTTLSISAPTTGTAPYTYVWYSGTSLTCTSDTSTGLTGLFQTFTPTSSTYYCVQETDSASSNEVVYTGTTQVTVNPALVASAAPSASNSVIDIGQSSTLTISAPTTGTSPYVYQWYSGTSPTCTSDSPVAGQTGLTYTASPSSSTYYCVKETDSASPNEVVYTGTTQVTVNPALVASPAPTASNSIIDNGNPTTLTVNAPTTGSAPYTYLWYSGTSSTCTSDTSTGLTGLSQTFTPSSSTYYCVQETDVTGSMVYTGTTHVTVNPALVASPAPTASNSVIDIGQSTTLTVNAPTAGTSPYTYLWYSGTSSTCTGDTSTAYTGLTQTFTPSTSTYYCVQETDNTGNVVYTGTTQVQVNTAFTASPAPTAYNSVIDIGQSTTLIANAPTTGTSPYAYVWYSGTSPTCTSDTSTAYTGLTQTFTPSTSTYYCVQETDNTGNVVYTGTTQVQVNSAFIASAAPTSSNSMINIGQSTTLTVNAPTTGTSPYAYVWYSGTSPTCTSDTATAYTGLTQTFTPSSSTYYCVQETDATGSAVYTGTTQVQVNTAFTASPAPTAYNSVIDIGQSTTLIANAPTTGTSPYAYVWYSGTSPTCTSDTATAYTGLTQTFTPSSSTYYCVQETDNTGNVVYTGTTQVTVNPALVASPAPTASNSTVDNGQPTTLTVNAPTTGSAPYTYLWYSGTSATCTSDTATAYTGLTQTFTPSTSTYYCVQETDNTGSAVYTGTTFVTANPSFVAPVISVNTTNVGLGGSVALSATSPLSGGTPTYVCQWLQEAPAAGSYNALGSSFSCDTSSLPTQSTGALSITGTWNFELQVTDSLSANAFSSPVSVGVNTITTTTSIKAAPACAFNVSLSSPSQFYLSPPSITFDYTASSKASCTPSAPSSGYVELYYNGALSSFETMHVPVQQLQAGITSGTISINSTNLTPGSYMVQFYLSSANYKSTASTSFYIIQPASILITNFTVQPSNVTLGSGVSLIQDVSNLGGLGSTNTTLNIAVSGPGNFYDLVHQKLGDIGKNNAQTVITQLAGDSVVAGSYTITENVSFTSGLTAGGITYEAGKLLSNTQRGSYTVFYNSSSAYNASVGFPTPPSRIGALSISSVPIYARVLVGNTTTNYLGLTDTKNLTVGVRIIVPNVPYGKITTSIKSFLVNEGTSEYVQFVFTPYPNATPGVYTVPILISTDDPGIITNGTVYLIFDIEKKTPAVGSFDISEELTNYGKNLGVSLNVYNPTHLALNNTIMTVRFPSFAAPIGDILLTGAQSNETTSGGETSLEWFIPSIQPGHSAQIGYSVSNITDLQLLLGPSISLASTSGSTAPTFTLINMAPINLTLGENGSLTVSGLYQGAYQSSMTLRLSSPSANVANPVQVVPDVMQSQIISAPFKIVPTTLGNTILSFAVKGQGINETYYIPIVVSAKSTALTRSVQTVEKNLLLIIATAITIMMLVIAIQVATEELPKSIRIEEGTEATSNTEMRRLEYDHVFELLSKGAAEKVTKMKITGVPTRWGVFTPLSKRDVRIINDDGHLTIYTRGPVANKLKAYMKSKKIPFVELMTE